MKSSIRFQSSLRLLGGGSLLAALVLASGCQEDPPSPQPHAQVDIPAAALTGSVVVHDEEDNQLVFLRSDAEGSLDVTLEPEGYEVVDTAISADQRYFFTLSRGVVPRREDSDAHPELRIYDGAADDAAEVKVIQLDAPMREIVLDPSGDWAICFSADASVANDNEVVLIDLRQDEPTPVSRTLRSFGGTPEGIEFSQSLDLPDGRTTRYLSIRSDRDLTLVDLEDLSRNDITIQLPEDGTGSAFAPAQVIFNDGDPDDPTDARIAIRLAQSSDLLLAALTGDPEDGELNIVPNLVDVGGIPTEVSFLRTDGGLRLAALVPQARRATLVNPESTLSEVVELPDSYQKLSLVTEETEGGGETTGDTALLWGGASSVAFWSLASASSTPYRSIEKTDLPISVDAVGDVPGDNSHLKILTGASSRDIYVLDLQKRQSNPLSVRSSSASTSISPVGDKMWVYFDYGDEFASVDLSNLHPSAVYSDVPLSGLFEIDSQGEGRSLILLHGQGEGVDVSWLDAADPKLEDSRYYSSLFLRIEK